MATLTGKKRTLNHKTPKTCDVCKHTILGLVEFSDHPCVRNPRAQLPGQASTTDAPPAPVAPAPRHLRHQQLERLKQVQRLQQLQLVQQLRQQLQQPTAATSPAAQAAAPAALVRAPT
ncbi:hypothetical protein FCV25MIE_10087 [Fagus crenata]